ncbi:MAG: sigma-70 family RNA polymerase sigma factor [Planctomycetota bacterium]|nr:sigma-70 family RNA polymerase sigma factor [Planctomycetota bacterium]
MVDLNHILRSAQEGDAQAAKELAALLYTELHEFARREMQDERPDHTLQPTALVNEAYLSLVAEKNSSFTDRDSFFAAAATAIRRVLVDHARRRAREKRGGAFVRIPLEGLDVAEPFKDEELLTLDEALANLASLDPTKARIVELRFFGGLSAEQIGRVIGTSESTVRREWRLARAWLRTHMDGARGS